MTKVVFNTIARFSIKNQFIFHQFYISLLSLIRMSSSPLCFSWQNARFNLVATRLNPGTAKTDSFFFGHGIVAFLYSLSLRLLKALVQYSRQTGVLKLWRHGWIVLGHFQFNVICIVLSTSGQRLKQLYIKISRLILYTLLF